MFGLSINFSNEWSTHEFQKYTTKGLKLKLLGAIQGGCRVAHKAVSILASYSRILWRNVTNSQSMERGKLHCVSSFPLLCRAFMFTQLLSKRDRILRSETKHWRYFNAIFIWCLKRLLININGRYHIIRCSHCKITYFLLNVCTTVPTSGEFVPVACRQKDTNELGAGLPCIDDNDCIFFT